MTEKDKCPITLFGDSIPKGVGFENGRFIKLDKTAVELVEGHYGIKIKNISSIGQTVKKINQRRILDKYIEENPGVGTVVLSIGGNDSDYDWQKIAENPKAYHSPVSEPEEFEKTYSLLVDKLLLAKKNVAITALTPINAKNYFDRISTFADKDRLLEWFNGDITAIYRHQELYNNIVSDIARKKGVDFIDDRSAFLYSLDFASCLCSDGIHLNAKGHEFAAKEIISSIDANGYLV